MNDTQNPNLMCENTPTDTQNRPTHEKMGRPTPVKIEEAWNGLYFVRVGVGGDDNRNKQYTYSK
jgi:hypothetical protein